MEQIIVTLILVLIGFFWGRRAEAKHYRSINKREDELRSLIVLPNRIPPKEFIRCDTQLVSGSVVVSVDYFKTFVAGLRNLVGGRVGSYESLVDRARREAILRMQEQAHIKGAKAVVNLKVETSRIGNNARNGLGSVELLAYGTAMIPCRNP